MHRSILSAMITSSRAKPQTQRQPWSPRALLSRAAKPRVGHESPCDLDCKPSSARLLVLISLMTHDLSLKTGLVGLRHAGPNGPRDLPCVSKLSAVMASSDENSISHAAELIQKIQRLHGPCIAARHKASLASRSTSATTFFRQLEPPTPRFFQRVPRIC